MGVRTSDTPITVLTVTRRAECLSRCVLSVRSQDYDGPVRHLFVVDGNPDCSRTLRGCEVPDEDVVYRERGPNDTDGPNRLAVLRNLAVDLAGDTWIAFLDDDNRWEPAHLRSLWAAIVDDGADIAYSQRQMFEADGSPYLREEFPWARSEVDRRAVYAYCVVAGIMSRGSNVVRDRLEMHFSCVDLGEWLFPPGFLRAHPFSSDYRAWEWQNIVVEDRDLPRAVFNSGLTVAATGEPTLHYFMGGYTNSAAGSSVRWEKPAAAVPATKGPRP